MSTRFLRTATLVILAACSTLALADTPTRVGRIALSQGQVGISGEQGEETSAALVNWPVTSRNQVTTGRDGRTEIRIGSTAIRLDADSALDVAELEDDSLRLHLHYGSASIRVRNPDVLRGFALSTPQGSVRMQEVGQMRIDAGRRQDTTVVSVFSGAAEIEGAGTRLVVRAGKRAQIGLQDVYTGLALRDSFDEWSMLRDSRDERSESVRYVSSEMTGYEDLDQHGVWREDEEYGPLWSPRNVAYGWTPYRDGRWTYLQPWGWTWVDNASWGYAPFHYGRWVIINQRWCWAPGRNVSRAIWSPALVGWVGGNNWNAHFGSGHARRAAPATGWYPLAPKDAYVPTYRMAHDNLRYLNHNAGAAQPDIRGRARDVRRDDHQRAGLTVVPHDQFRQRGTVLVPTAPRGTVSPAQLFPNSSTPAVPPAPQMTERERSRDWRRVERSAQAPAARNVAEPAPAVLAVQPLPARAADSDVGRRMGSFTNDARRQRMEPSTSNMPTRIAPVQETAMPKPAVMLSLPAAPQPSREERVNRFRRSDVESEQRDRDPERARRPRGAESFQQQAQVQQQQQLQMLQLQQQQAQQQQLRAQQVQQVQQQQLIEQQQQAQQQQLRAQQVQQVQQQQIQQQQQRQQEQQQRAAQVQQPAQFEQPAAVAQPRPQRDNTGMRRAREDANRMR